jgi:hypothetical protein
MCAVMAIGFTGSKIWQYVAMFPPVPAWHFLHGVSPDGATLGFVRPDPSGGPGRLALMPRPGPPAIPGPGPPGVPQHPPGPRDPRPCPAVGPDLAGPKEAVWLMTGHLLAEIHTGALLALGYRRPQQQ